MNNLQCKICGFEGMNLVTHLKFKHLLSVNDYRLKYGNCQIYIHSDELKKKISNTLKKLNENIEFRIENSKRQKNGASCLTTNYWIMRGFTYEHAKQKVSELQKKNSQKHILKNNLKECSHFNKEYWIKRGYSDDIAKREISKLQSKLSARSSKFSGHKRTDEQKEKISSAVKRMIEKFGRGNWAKHFGNFNGRSKAEIEFYNYIKENIDVSVEANVPIGNYIVDVIKGTKIIEFYGDFWHANPLIFSECKKLYPYGKSGMLAGDIWKKDSDRISCIKSDGYEVMIIWEFDWNNNKSECIDKIKKYLI